jgi:hypothetical protein
MEHVSGMQSFERTKGLVYKILAMVIAQLLSTNDPMKIGLHKFLYEVDLPEAVEIGRSEDVEDGDDILMVKVTKKLYLAESTKTEHGVVEGGDTFYSDAALRCNVGC